MVNTNYPAEGLVANCMLLIGELKYHKTKSISSVNVILIDPTHVVLLAATVEWCQR